MGKHEPQTSRGRSTQAIRSWEITAPPRTEPGTKVMHIDKDYIVIGVALALALTAGAASAVYQSPTTGDTPNVTVPLDVAGDGSGGTAGSR